MGDRDREELAKESAPFPPRRSGQEEAGHDSRRGGLEEDGGPPQGDLTPASDQLLSHQDGGSVGRSAATGGVRLRTPPLGSNQNRPVSSGRSAAANVVRLPSGLPLPGGAETGPTALGRAGQEPTCPQSERRQSQPREVQ